MLTTVRHTVIGLVAFVRYVLYPPVVSVAMFGALHQLLSSDDRHALSGAADSRRLELGGDVCAARVRGCDWSAQRAVLLRLIGAKIVRLMNERISTYRAYSTSRVQLRPMRRNVDLGAPEQPWRFTSGEDQTIADAR